MTLDMALFEGIQDLDEILATLRPEGEPGQDASCGDEPQDAMPADGDANRRPNDADCQPNDVDRWPNDADYQDEAVSGERLVGDRPPLLIIDADACPVTREALAEARRAGIGVIIAGNTTQNLEAHIRHDDPRSAEEAVARKTRGFWADTLTCGVGADSADFAIVERLQPGDVVVTQDIGLAGMCLGRGAQAIGVRGRPYDRATIDAQLFIRHEEKKVRRQGGRTKGPAAFTSEDRQRFVRNLRRMLEEALSALQRA